MLPPALTHRIVEVLSQEGLGDRIGSVESISGGCIHHACKLTTNQGAFFLKWNANPQKGMFSSEVYGISLIRAVQAIQMPAVVNYSDQVDSDCHSYILMEWIECGHQSLDQETLGEHLAQLHHARPPQTQYGLDVDNYIGSTPQINTWSSNWVDFFRNHRLGYQIDLADRLGKLPVPRRARLEELITRLDQLLGGDTVYPALLHGDLWAGNILAGPHGKSYLIDPAVYYGSREAEIAYTQLFGGFSNRFYQAYQASWPLDPGYTDRRDIYNLYHLLNHLNLFGEVYGSHIDTMLKRYVRS